MAAPSKKSGSTHTAPTTELQPDQDDPILAKQRDHDGIVNGPRPTTAPDQGDTVPDEGSLEGRDVVVTESGAIVLYLARKSGALMPRDLAGEAQVLRWSLVALNTIELPLLARWFVDMSGGKGTKPSEALAGWGAMRLGQLDGWLADREFVATDAFTVADILMAHVLGIAANGGVLDPYAHVVAYRGRCNARPAWQRTLDAYCDRVEAA